MSDTADKVDTEFFKLMCLHFVSQSKTKDSTLVSLKNSGKNLGKRISDDFFYKNELRQSDDHEYLVNCMKLFFKTYFLFEPEVVDGKLRFELFFIPGKDVLVFFGSILEHVLVIAQRKRLLLKLMTPRLCL